MKFRELNHVAIHVADVDVSSAFYRDILQLPEIPRPAFSFPGAWFLLGEQQDNTNQLVATINNFQDKALQQHNPAAKCDAQEQAPKTPTNAFPFAAPIFYKLTGVTDEADLPNIHQVLQLLGETG